ncbi:methyltransferase family protein [Saprospira grandis DSM 2844]|uniref:Methyltransferase family protein n=1 Tax=Saprospira grandis DSM 2844 TaxID=694433 RepID=J0PBE5_9BACT|nr:class I SAM-dependent methyltransferase [Saprospira grandis]EJF54967.1 methyltransferase family protein [Saprospira grandis DSM 2844]
MKEFWNQRYGAEDFAYGRRPNRYFAAHLHDVEPGKILLIAEGEGRNAIFAAQNGWDVCACDLSEEGQEKALAWAKKEGLDLRYDLGDFGALDYPKESFDALGLVYAHFPPHLKVDYLRKAANLIKPGGLLLLEGFAKGHTVYQEKNPAVGGPKNVEMLFDKEEMLEIFSDFEFSILKEEVIELQEGLYHNGEAEVLRIMAQKKVN